jgi:hypothetical protein
MAVSSEQRKIDNTLYRQRHAAEANARARAVYAANREPAGVRRRAKYAETKRHKLAMKEATSLAKGMTVVLSETEKAILKEKVLIEPEILAESLNQTLNDEILVGHVILELIRLLE